ncbi:MAG: AtpZ/AtpI family protein [Planctomycetota bacterium]|nr:AtpZ/AtpI family protein [Planctomycetota bacterium]
MIPKSDDQRAEDSAQKSALAKYLRYSHLGMLFFAAVGLFTWGGIWLDGRLETGVLFTLLGLALGFAGGLRALYKELVRSTSSPGPPDEGEPRAPGDEDEPPP